MSRGDSHDLAERAQLLRNLAEVANLGTIEDTIRMGMGQLGALTGDPDRVLDLAAAYRTAAGALAEAGAELSGEYSEVSWTGSAAGEAVGTIRAEATRLAEDAEVLTAVATHLTAHADRLRQAQRTHDHLHQRLVDLEHSISLVRPLLTLDAVAAGVHVGLVATALEDGAALLTEVREDADGVAGLLRRLREGGVAAARESGGG
ncbi:uncharacterized protein YukE [Crossiella equi]|uniref:Uncharacterized protein YukE n=1 Tax=Crossiella equi TaxID=130796 RepID=A0ABS5AC94_9PSEU|nr:hypothetical protein [Crossiella equi]MBP2474194.1 uncharacterized protein YukE [Crossiella equi]